MASTSPISDFINRYVASFKTVTLREFLIEFSHTFYPDQEISFVDYLIELSKKENEGQFIVHQDKLIEYGIITNKNSGDLKDQLDALSLVEGQDYLLQEVFEQLESVYMLTPDGLKLALMRATRDKTHTANVEKYSKYYLLLEKVVGYYMDYQLALEQAKSKRRDTKIDEQSKQIDLLLGSKQDEQSKQIDLLLGSKQKQDDIYIMIKQQQQEMLENQKIMIGKQRAMLSKFGFSFN